MENINEETIIPTSYIDNIFHSCEEVSEVPSECILLQTDVIEEAFLQMNILKQEQESNSLCSEHHPYFTPVSAFGDFISFSSDLVHKLDNLNGSEKPALTEPCNENRVNVEEIIVEEVAEQEVVSDALQSSNSLYKNTYEIHQNLIETTIGAVFYQHLCDFCDQKFSKKSLLLKHVFLCHSEQPTFECSICGNIFFRKKSLISHLRKHDNSSFKNLHNHSLEEKYPAVKSNRDQILRKPFLKRFTNNTFIDFQDTCRPFQCNGCDKSFTRKNDFLKHLCSNEKNDICWDGTSFRCEICFDTFSDEESLHDHCCTSSNKTESVAQLFADTKFHQSQSETSISSKRHRGVFDGTRVKSSYSCEHCGHISKNSYDLYKHMNEHEKSDLIPCLHCKKMFISRASLVEHLNNEHHIRTDEFTCTYCGKRCKDFRGLQKHSSVYSGGQFLICKTCGKQFHTRTRLKRHMHSHRNKVVICVVCGEKMPDNRALANHRASHNLVISRNGASTTRFFPCHACDKIFGSRSSQQIHMRVHTGERPYSCRFCVKAFADGGTLRKHERIHTGEKPYACPVCEKAFNQRVVLREHIKAHHANMHSARDECHKCEVCGIELTTSEDLFIHLVKHSDDNTAKHRMPLTKPRKYKKWKITKDEELDKNFCSKTPGTKINGKTIKSECVEENQLTFQITENPFEISYENEIFLSTESDQLIKVNHVNDSGEIRLFMSENNDCLLPFSNEVDDKTWKSNELIDEEKIIYRNDNPFAEELPDNNSSLRNEFWSVQEEKNESDVCVHSGLGLGATVEL